MLIQSLDDYVKNGFTFYHAFTGQQFLKESKKHRNKFERGKTDEFEIEAIEIGEIKKIV